MKKITLLFVMLLFSIAGFSQNIVIGTGTDLTDGTGSDPVDGYYNSFRYQVVYTAAELSASLTPYDEITGLGFSVSEDYAGGNLQGYEIKMGHTSAANSAAHDVSPTSIVKNAFDYDPTATAAGVFDMISFDANFVWNGVDNVLVEICSAGQNSFSSPYGGVRATNVASGSRNNRVDGSSACGNNTNLTNGNKPNIQFNYIDGTPPACLPPNTLTATIINATTVDLGWITGGSGEGTWDVEVLPIASVATGTPTDVGVANPFNKTGLTPNTAYKFYVRANCGGGDSTWTGPYNFTTPCAAIVAPYSEDFETFTVSATAFADENCWTGTSTAYLWEVAATTDTSSGATGPGSGVSTGNYLFTEATSGNTGDAIDLVSPLVDLTALTTPALSFDYHMFGADMGTLEVIVTTGTPNNVTLFTISGNQHSETDPFTTAIIDISAYVGQTIQITIRGTRGADYTSDIAIDNVNFIEAPSCIPPNTLTASLITDVQANLGWITGGSGELLWDVEYGVSPYAATGAPTSGATTGVSNPFILTGLTAATTYEYYVRADCGGSTSTWTGPFTFTTACGTITPAYTNDFTTFLGNCWEEGDNTDIVTGPNNTNGNWAEDGFLNSGATGAARFNFFLNGDTDWIVTPTLDLSGGSLGVSFDVGATPWSGSTAVTMGADDQAQLLISSDNGATWVNLMTWNDLNTPSNTGDNHVIDLSAYTSATTKIAFWCDEGSTDTGDYNFYVDNFTVDLYSILSVDDLQLAEGFKFYPNPVKDVLNVSAKNNIEKLQIVNMLGQVVKTATPNMNTYQLNFSELSAGIYFVKASINNTEGTFRIVKQ